MRPRASGGFEPDDLEQVKLVELWHLSRTALAHCRTEDGAQAAYSRSAQLTWVVDNFLTEHPDVGRKWIYVWCERYLGRVVDPDPIPVPPGMQELCQLDADARTVPTRPKRSRSKKRAK
jgi:hypothetical protein